MKAGDLVQFINLLGDPMDIYGVVLGFHKDRVRVHWQSEIQNTPGDTWAWGLLKVVDEDR